MSADADNLSQPGSTRRMALPLALVAAWLFGPTAFGQTVPLPPIGPQDTALASDPSSSSGSVPFYSTGPQRVLPAMYPEDLVKSPVPPDEPSAADTRPPGSKPGVFQQVAVTATYLPRFHGDLGMTDLATSATFGFPFPTAKSPLVVTPSFETHWLDGPNSPADLPPEIYDGAIGFRYLRKLSDRWGMDLGVAPGWHGDLEPGSGRAFRLPSRAILAYDWAPDLQLIGGIAYLDREDVNFLPVAGVIWTPNDDTRFELIVPRPRIARRFFVDGNIENWLYLAGEFGGGSYGITRASGIPDVVTSSDLRVILGFERKAIGGINLKIESGYVFARNLEYLSGTPDFKPDDTFMTRVGLWY